MSEEQTTTDTQDTPTNDNPEQSGSGFNLLLSGEEVNTDTPTEDNTDTPTDDTTTDEESSTDEGERPEWLPEKFKSAESMAEAYKQLESRFGGFTGAPEGDYEVSTPEGVDFQFYEDSEFGVGKFKEFAKEANMSQETFGKAMEFYINSRAYDAMVEQQQREDGVYEAFGGKDEAIKQIPQISARLKGTLGEEGMKVYQDAASGSHTAAASAIKLAGMLMNKLDGEFTPPTQTGSKVSSMSKSELSKALTTEEYKRDPEYKAMIDAEYKKAYGF